MIRYLQSLRLLNAAKKYYIDTSNLKWETGSYVEHYLDTESLSRLNKEVQEARGKERDSQLKILTALTGVIGALTGVIGVLIALVALLLKK